MQVGILGINHKTANLSFREQIARAAAGLAGDRSRFFPHPIVLLSTCNRTEIYFGGEDLSIAHSDLLAHLRTVMEEPFEHRLYSYFGIDCFVHLARVTAGLDSAIIAETEIQRQVKVAYADSHSLTSSMHFIFQRSLKLGKAVRNLFPQEAPTLHQAVWKLAHQELGDLRAKKTLFVGYSETNRAIAHYFSRRKVASITFCTRSSLPNAVDRSELSRLHNYDLVICATTSSQPLITQDASTLIFDLSVPRNVDPRLARYNIEDVHHWIERQRAIQTEELERCNDYISREANRLTRNYKTSPKWTQNLGVNIFT